MTNQTNHDVAPSPVAQQGRDAFEDWAGKRWLPLHRHELGGDSYALGDVELAWRAWQAARASLPAGFTPEQVAELVAARDKILAASLPAGGVVESDDMVAISRSLVSAACSAIHKKRDAPKVLARLREVAMSTDCDYAELRQFAIDVEQALEPCPILGRHIDRIKALVRCYETEPVVWRWRNSVGEVVTDWLEYQRQTADGIKKQVAAEGGTVEYAYATPQPSETQGRRQMTDEQIISAIKACEPEDASKEGWIWRTRIKWARAIEAHHGIPASPQDGGEHAAT